MLVLVTGATGTLGRVTIARLLAEGHKVAVLTRRPYRAQTLFAETVAIHEWHPITEAVPKGALDGVDAILHLMGEPFAGRPASDRAVRAVQSRVNATRRLVAAIGAAPVRLVTTSMALPATDHDSKPKGLLADGSPRLGSSGRSKERAASVAEWEAEAQTAAAHGASVAIVRLGLLAAPSGPLAALVRLARRGVGADLKGVMVPAITLPDAAALLSGLLANRDLDGVMDGVAPEPVRGDALALLMASLSPVGRIVPLPGRFLDRSLGLSMALLQGRQPLAPHRLLEAGAIFSQPDVLVALELAIAEAATAPAAEAMRWRDWLPRGRTGRHGSAPAASVAEPERLTPQA